MKEKFGNKKFRDNQKVRDNQKLRDNQKVRDRQQRRKKLASSSFRSHLTKTESFFFVS